MLSFIYIILQCFTAVFNEIPVVSEECNSGAYYIIVQLTQLAGLKYVFVQVSVWPVPTTRQRRRMLVLSGNRACSG